MFGMNAMALVFFVGIKKQYRKFSMLRAAAT